MLKFILLPVPIQFKIITEVFFCKDSDAFTTLVESEALCKK